MESPWASLPRVSGVLRRRPRRTAVKSSIQHCGCLSASTRRGNLLACCEENERIPDRPPNLNASFLEFDASDRRCSAMSERPRVYLHISRRRSIPVGA